MDKFQTGDVVLTRHGTVACVRKRAVCNLYEVASVDDVLYAAHRFVLLQFLGAEDLTLLAKRWEHAP